MARVIEGLASVGYVGRYGVLPASAAGAAQQRKRVFIIAHPHDQTPNLPGQASRNEPGLAMLILNL